MAEPSDRSPRLTRRRLLAVGGGATVAALGGAGYGVYRLVGGSEPAPRPRHVAAPRVRGFRSRPDLAPPVVTVDVADHDPRAGYVFLGPSGKPGQHGALILDGRGEPVWFSPTAGDRDVMNFRVQRYRGEPVLTWWEGKVTGGHGSGHYVIADSRYRQIARVDAGDGLSGDLHEFLLTPEGTALLTAYRTVAADLRPVGGPEHGALLDSIVQEVDVATGRVLFDWTASHHVALRESYRKLPKDPKKPFDFFHVNAIDVTRDGNLLVCARHTWAVYKLDRRSGAVLWRLAGKRSDFRLGKGVRFAWQHDARMREDGTITLFDDGAQPKVEPFSRGLVLALDEPGRRVSVVRQYVHPKRLLADAMGNMQALPDGGFLVGWGTEPYVTDFAHDGRVRFDARMPKGRNSYRAFRSPWTGRPATLPSLAAWRQGDDPRAYASWNGATEVAFWEVHAGRGQAALRTLPLVQRTGFETTIRLPGGTKAVSVTALDARRRPLGSSAVVSVQSGSPAAARK